MFGVDTTYQNAAYQQNVSVLLRLPRAEQDKNLQLLEKASDLFIAKVNAARAAEGKPPIAVPKKVIQYLDPKPQPFIVQIGLIEYFERITKLKTDRWQKHFLNYLQTAVENMHVKPTWAEFHAESQLGKTRGLSQVFPTWCFGHAPMFRYTLAMYNISRSTAHADVMIQIMRSSMYREMFPNEASHLPKFASKEGFMTNARRDVESGQMDAQMSLNPVGLESGMTGSSFDWLTIDDPYKEPRDAFSSTMWDNLDRFWQYGVKSRLTEHTCIAAMFHRYNYDDFGGYLLNTGKFDYVRYATIADGPYIHEETGQKFDDPLGREIGEYICPERRTESYYRDKRDNPKVWLSMFQGRPGREEGDFFQVGKIEVVTDELAAAHEWSLCKSRGRGWDHAATQGSGDNSAGAWAGFQPDGTFVVADVFSAQLDSASRVAKQRELAESDGTDTTVVVPEGVGADGKDNVFLMRQNLQGFNVVGRKVTNAAPGSDAKKRRAYNLSIAVNSGKVKFLGGDWVEKVKMLMRRFGNSLSGDDEIDAMADVFNHLYEEFHKGLVLTNFSHANLMAYDDFLANYAPNTDRKIPSHWTLYAGVKITPDASRANSAVLVAKAAVNSGLTDTLFIVAEYKEYTAEYQRCFDWLDDALKTYCANPKAAMIWLHPDSEEYTTTIRQKLGVSVSVFNGSDADGHTEMNWYAQTRETGKTGLYGLIHDHNQLLKATDALGLVSTRQEAGTWGYTDKGVASQVGAVLDNVRMIAYQFRTSATPLTADEKIEAAMPVALQAQTIAKEENLQTKSDAMQRRMIELERVTRQVNKPVRGAYASRFGRGRM